MNAFATYTEPVVTLLDYPRIRWSQARMLLEAKDRTLREFDILLRNFGIAPREDQLSVLVKPTSLAHCYDIRDWLAAETLVVNRDFEMCGNFERIDKLYSTTRRYHGIRFTFKDLTTAVYFKLKYADDSYGPQTT